MGSLELRTHLPGGVPDALNVSLDLDVEVVAGKRWHAKTSRGGYGYRTAGVMARGETVRWSMRLFGLVPVRHTSLISSLVEDDGEGGAAFVDEMTAGVFTSYRHAHRFEPDGAGTLMTDEVAWVCPAGPLGALADRLFVGRLMERLLRDRNAEIIRRLS
jgi:ligand-binding SRPBCC domain-containing protein